MSEFRRFDREHLQGWGKNSMTSHSNEHSKGAAETLNGKIPTTSSARTPGRFSADSFERLLALIGSDGGGRCPFPDMDGIGHWDDLLKLARQHFVSPFIYKRLRLLPARVPTPILESLRADYRTNAFRNLRLLGQLHELTEAFRKSGISVLALKGMHLIAEVYEDPPTRVVGDIDLLVQQSDLDTTADLLLRLGYASDSAVPAAAITTVRHHLEPFSRPNSTPVEVHWNTTLPSETHTQSPLSMWARSRRIRHQTIRARGLCFEDLLVHLCVHTSYHHQFDFGLRPSIDIAELVRTKGDEMDWGLFRRLADRAGHRRGIFLALMLARELVGARIPEETLECLSPRDSSEQALADARALLGSRTQHLKEVAKPWADLWHGDSVPARIRALARRVFISRTELARQYQIPPTSMRLYLYYLVRSIQLVMRWHKTGLRLLRREPTSVEVARRRAHISTWLSQN